MKEMPMNAATVLRLPWFSILVVHTRKPSKARSAPAARPRVRIAGLR